MKCVVHIEVDKDRFDFACDNFDELMKFQEFLDEYYCYSVGSSSDVLGTKVNMDLVKECMENG